MFEAPALDEASPLLSDLPLELIGLLRQRNGLIAFDGGFHMRGICDYPVWHSLGYAWRGPKSITTLFPAVHPEDVPFAQDCLGDQFLLRGGSVSKLSAETGEVHGLGLELEAFLRCAYADPVEFLGLEPLLEFHERGSRLQPGQLVHAYPPFCTSESGEGVSLSAMPMDEVLQYLSDFASAIAAVPEGGKIRVEVQR